MFEGQPKGFIRVSLSEYRRAFRLLYHCSAIFTLFLQAKFGFTASETSDIFSTFLAGVYFTPLIGGWLADKFGYGKMVTSGIFIMFLGYLLLSIPAGNDSAKWMMFGALTMIALGTGLFKGKSAGNGQGQPLRCTSITETKRELCFQYFHTWLSYQGALYSADNGYGK